ncbi:MULTISPECIES: segregation/condensation protein A [unclassified Paenibacillus]|uniref:segregation and condensation protein A n=1 Tax=unclassified Paenibacillus TaxID=185978 RepID=UPI001AE13BED|nr:segregation and condensation protein A [Paenibacillus sp. PvP091]MBP1169420.1 segregation and condensation protein A [Paenibacillus sp. PvR098]MBP2440448.1 segregation and condensation protein A [Paenibacillus sp. PvP052]
MKVTVKLETFEGPLDLLLHLIDKAEVDIYDIPIKDITDQYMEYLDAMQELELELTSEFLVMAATLLSIKSKMLLPKPPILDLDFDDYMMDEDYDPRSELVAKLIEYRKYKAIADHLRDKEVERSLIYTREPEDLTPYVPVVMGNPVKGLHVADLVLAFRKALRRMQSRNAIAKIRKDEISVKDRMVEVIETLEKQGGKVLFSKLLQVDATKDAVVVTFLALLELMKVKRIVCFQHKLFDDIVIQAREDETANGFRTDEISY